MSNTVSKTVWAWSSGKKAATRVTRKQRLIKASLQFGLMATVASFMFFRFNHRLAGAILYALSLVVLSGGLWFESVYRFFEKLTQMLARGVGLGLTWLLMVPLYYLFFLPGRIVLRLQGKDPLKRSFDKTAPTYWEARDRALTPDYFKRQF